MIISRAIDRNELRCKLVPRWWSRDGLLVATVMMTATATATILEWWRFVVKNIVLAACFGSFAALVAAMPAAAADDPALMSFGGGLYDQTTLNPGLAFLKVSAQDKHYQAADIRAEYRFGKSLLAAIEPYAKLKPWLGVEATSDGAVYGLGGILFDIPLGPFVFTPSFGAGLYSSGSGKKLGSPIEFRTMVELGYQFDNQSRFSVGYSHISNAGITTTNPGSNILSVYYHVPADWIMGK
ncbi:MAG: acyloxyacyl hydrolase [Rhodospirillaceae bacterium]